MKTTTSAKTTKMAHTAILIAIIMVLGVTPIGYLSVSAISMSFITIPVAIGAMMLGAKTGALLGAFFGLSSFLVALNIMPQPDPIGIVLMSISPILTFILCMVPRIIVGWLTGLIFEKLRNTKMEMPLVRIIASISAPVLNTILFCSTLILLFGNTEWSEGLGMVRMIPVLIGVVWLNGVIEAIVCSVAAFAVTTALSHFNKRLK